MAPRPLRRSAGAEDERLPRRPTEQCLRPGGDRRIQISPFDGDASRDLRFR